MADEVWGRFGPRCARIQERNRALRVVVIPSGMPDPPSYLPEPGRERVVIVVANYGYGPNANGARWMVERCGRR